MAVTFDVTACFSRIEDWIPPVAPLAP